MPIWLELYKTTGIIGTPLLEVNTRFIGPATYGERLRVHTSIQEWRSEVFIQKHIVKRDAAVLCEGTETGAFCIYHPDDGRAIGLYLTATGEQMMRQAETTASGLESDVCHKLTAAETKTLLKLLQKVYL